MIRHEVTVDNLTLAANEFEATATGIMGCAAGGGSFVESKMNGSEPVKRHTLAKALRDLADVLRRYDDEVFKETLTGIKVGNQTPGFSIGEKVFRNPEGVWGWGYIEERVGRSGWRVKGSRSTCDVNEMHIRRNDSENTKVDHPPHYGGDNVYEAIKVIRAWSLNFALGNAVKYIARAGKKPGESALDDLRKSRRYIDNEIATLEKKP